MSFNICSISGMIAEIPVLSKKTGHIYEKRLIEKHLNISNKCPVTGSDMSIEDLIEIKCESFTKPRSVQTSSIPGMFNDLQNEWEKIILETYNNKKQLEAAKQQLSHALYQYDAACRVISNLVRERDEAREELFNLKADIEDGVEQA
jgi:pre-mRNA-processing factor 19